MTNKETERKNKIVAAIMAVIAIISALGAVYWFTIYAPLLLK